MPLVQRMPERPLDDEEAGIQAKLEVNRSDDPYEEEADRAAEQVLSGDSPPVIQQLNSSMLHRQTTLEDEEQEGEQEDNLLTKPQPGKKSTVRPGVEASVRSSCQQGGKPLPNPVRANLETAFGRDFSKVRIHTGPHAADLSESLNAQAFTHQQEIYFNQGKFDPDADQGRRLLTHELAHVVQQGGAPGLIQRQEEETSESPAGESTEGKGRNQTFGFSEDEMESRLSSTAA